MFCVECGTKFEGKFCPNCGHASEDVASVSTNINQSLDQKQELMEAIKKLGEYYKKLKCLSDQVHSSEYRITYFEYKRKELSNKKESGMLMGMAKAYGKATLAVATCGVSAVISGVSKHGKNKKKAEMNFSIDQEIQNELNKANQNIMEAKSIVSSPEFCELCNIIPEEYQYPDTVDFMVTALRQGRADNWKELVNLYHDDMFKQELIEINLEQLDVQKDILDNTYDILEETKLMTDIEIGILDISLDERNLLIEKMIADNEFMQNQSKAMKKIYKQTKKIGRNAKHARRSVGLLAFIEVTRMIF